MKYLDTVQAFTSSPASAGSVGSAVVLGIPQGSGVSQRLGERVTLKSIHVRGNIQLAEIGTITNSYGIIRLIIVQDTQANGAFPAIGDILQSPAANDVVSFKNLENSQRFRTIWDRTFDIDANNGNGTNSGGRFISFQLNKKVNIPIMFSNSATGVINNIKSNNLVFASVGQSYLGTNIYVDSQVRVRFSDS